MSDEVRQFVVGMLQTNCYAYVSEGECLVVDPGASGARIAQQLADVQVRLVVATHRHHDHVGGVKALVEACGAPWAISAMDADGAARALELLNEGDEVLEIGAGSGCLIITLALEKNIKASACDVTEKALAVASQNAKDLGAECAFIKSDLFENVKGTFNMIVSNPPYIKTADIEGLDAEVKDYESKEALDGGADGLDFYRRIAKEAPKHLKADGWLLFEIGYDQAKDVEAILKDAGFGYIEVSKDLSGKDRVVGAQISAVNET